MVSSNLCYAPCVGNSAESCGDAYNLYSVYNLGNLNDFFFKS